MSGIGRAVRRGVSNEVANNQSGKGCRRTGSAIPIADFEEKPTSVRLRDNMEPHFAHNFADMTGKPKCSERGYHDNDQEGRSAEMTTTPSCWCASYRTIT